MRVPLCCAVTLLSACDGEILGGLTSMRAGAPAAELTCDPTANATQTLDQLAAEFAATLHPSVVRDCTGCHAPASGRPFVVETDGAQTFYRAFSLGLFRDSPGSLVARVSSADALARMPRGLPQWSRDELERLATLACAARRLDGSGPPPDEVFPPELLQPWSGPQSTDDDNTFVNDRQLRARVIRVFGESWIRDGVDRFAENIALFGGANFTDRFNEARVATPEFLLGLDLLAPDVCARAADNHSAPFTGFDFDLASTDASVQRSLIARLYERMLFRPPDGTELSKASALLGDVSGLTSPTDAWQALCEGMVRHPDFLWTLPPSAQKATGAVKQRLLVIKLAMDLLGRPASGEELALVDQGRTMEEIVDRLLASPELKDWFFHRMRLRTQSHGTAQSDEAARLWTYVAVNDRPLQELFVGEYGVDPAFERRARPAYHGKSGLLTTRGYLADKPGLPHFNYPARVLEDFLGYAYEIPPEVLALRKNSTAASTVAPSSLCFSCHQNLTPLAYQRLAWDDDGEHRDVDAQGLPIDDSDHGVVATYAFKGKGIEAFATQAVKKEAFIRRMINSQYLLLFGRELRHREDERALYRQLWDVAVSGPGTFKALLRTIALSDRYQRSSP